MRSAKRPVTPRLLDLFRRQERGLGVREDYVAWTRIRRSDPPSIGRSHLHRWRDRQLDLTSDLQLAGFHFAAQLANLEDQREHFPLSLHESRHELAAYDMRQGTGMYPGTLEVARRLGIRHPQVADDQTTEPKVLTSEQLLTLREAPGHLSLLAVAYRHRAAARPGGALAIQRAYWHARGVPWLLITPNEFDRDVELTLRRTACWALAPPVSDAALATAIEAATENAGRPLTQTLYQTARSLGDLHEANRALWQAIWRALLPVDLRRGWRPQEPLRLIDLHRWWQQNPIASRRSAWT
jgi:hypothetical protein